MTNTKFRKRALISSVAMLLVALVALGSATFAWFSTTNSATAGMFRAKTAPSSNILVGEGKNDKSGGGDNGVVGWGSDITFEKYTSTNTDNMVPVTTNDTTAWYTILADDYNVGYEKAATAKTSVTDAQTNGQHAKFTRLYIKSVSATKNIQIKVSVSDPDPTGSNTDGIEYLRVALVPITKQTQFAGENFLVSENGSKTMIFSDNQKNDRSKTGDWTSANSGSANPSDSEVGTFGTAYALGSATADAIYGYDVYAYYEGTDFDCKDANAGTDLKVSFEVSEVPSSP